MKLFALHSVSGRRIVFFCFLVSVFTQQISAQSLDISGNYTINPAGGAYDPGLNDNFLSFSEAVDTLINRGIGGTVNIDVTDGSYNEAFEITAIPGASLANLVTFQSASSDSTGVYLNYTGFTSGNPRIVLLNGASYLKFKHLSFDMTGGSSSYGQAFFIGGASHHIYFENNNFIGEASGTSSQNDNRALIAGWESGIEYLEFRNNRFTYGEAGIAISGSAGARGMIIENNLFFDQTENGIYLRLQDAPIVRNNSISNTLNTGKIGIQMQLVDKGFEVSGNKINLKGSSAGIYIRDCDGTPGNEGMIINNFVYNASWGSGQQRGILVNNSTYLNFYHNSVHFRKTWYSNNSCFLQENNGNNLEVVNNSFVNKSGGYAFNVSNGSAISYSNNNNYFSYGNFLGRWGSTDLSTLANIASSSGDDGASVSVFPKYFSNEDLHTTNFRLESKGANLLSDVPFDIDGDDRSTTPDIGADEFFGIGSSLSGEYFIGGSNPDFINVQHAADSLNTVGVSGPVILSIRDDGSPLDDQIILVNITGSSATNTVTFRPDPANTGNVIISHDGSSGGNYTVHFLRTSNVILEDLTFSADNSINSTVVRFAGLCENITIRGCTLNSLGTSNNNAAIYSSENLLDNIIVSGNTISGGYRGIHIDGLDVSSQKATKILIDNNTFTDHYLTGAYLKDCIAPRILNNVMVPGSLTSNYWGVFLENCTNNYEIAQNKVLYNVDDGGIIVQNCS
jgi:parallel beta-helix repeat protein